MLRGLRATCHWSSLERLREFGADPTPDRVVFQGKVVTAAGVSSGIDMALALVARLTNVDIAQAIQLSIEYDPQPPFDAGSPSKAAPHIVELVRRAQARVRAPQHLLVILPSHVARKPRLDADDDIAMAGDGSPR